MVAETTGFNMERSKFFSWNNLFSFWKTGKVSGSSLVKARELNFFSSPQRPNASGYLSDSASSRHNKAGQEASIISTAGKMALQWMVLDLSMFTSQNSKTL